MSEIVSSLSQWTNENGRELLGEIFASSPTVAIADVYEGIKYIEAINVQSDTLTFQAGGVTGRPGNSGSTTFTQVNLQVDPVMTFETINPRTFEQYWMQSQMAEGIEGSDEIPAKIKEMYVTNKLAHVQREVERMIWQGNKTTGTGNLQWTNGFLQKLNNTSQSATCVSYLTTYTGHTGFVAGSGMTYIDNMSALIPEDIAAAEGLTAFMSIANAKKLATDLRNANHYHFTGTYANGVFSYDYPLSNIKIVGTIGLTSSNAVLLAPAKNLKVGTDMKSDMDKLDIYYNKRDRVIDSVAEFKLGVAIGRPEYVVFKAS